MAEAESGAPDGMVYFADEQTAGRGRGAHAWSSPPGSGLYLSVLLRPRMAPADVLWLSLAAGLAVHNAVKQATSLEADLRWPNDLLLGRKKFCGILTELNAEVTRVRHLVVGIGINVHQQAFEPGLATPATSLDLASGRTVSRQPLLIALLKSLEHEARGLQNPGEAAEIPARVQAASSWVLGRQVEVHGPQACTGVTAGLDGRGFLRVETAAGLVTVQTGGIRLPEID
jgi:BirA family biotin operon repressor/biotin-[acetyl-CoA-carboxylase] ligase